MSHSDCVVFVVVVDRRKRKVDGGWTVCFLVFVLFFFHLFLWFVVMDELK